MQASADLSAQVGQLSAHTPDEPFLFRLFAESQPQLDALRANEALWQSLVEMQYRGRQKTWAERFPEAVDSILLDEDERPAGRLLLDQQPGCLRIVDMAVLNGQRGKGLGTSALKACQARCGKTGLRLELRVAQANPARRLYERLGFRMSSEDAVAVEMVWSAVQEGGHDEVRE